MFFKDKTVLIVSPEKWGKLRVSKHNYAISLVKHCSKVLFLNPPDLNSSVFGEVELISEGVFVISYKPLARGKKFIGRFLYRFLQYLQFKYLLKVRANGLDLVWCFDDGTFEDLKIFESKFVVYHPVDHTLSRKQSACAKSADVVFASSPRILEYQTPVNKKGFIINHGLNKVFEQNAKNILGRLNTSNSGELKYVGFWGSLLKESLDKKKILELVSTFPELDFLFIGPYSQQENNLGGLHNNEIEYFIESLKSKPNVKLTGPKSSIEIIQLLEKLQVLLNLEYPYSSHWDNGNPHKIMEYLSTGAVVFSTPMVMYENSDLIFETSLDGNVVLDFSDLRRNFRMLSSREESFKRINFALENTYEAQLSKVSSILENL